MSRPKRKVLISGAGIAGIVLAYWLERAQFDVTIVEKARDMRSTGQAVEVSTPAGLEIIKSMGIQDVIRSKGTTEVGLRFVDDSGQTVFQNDVDRKHGRSFTSENEILRGDLADILYQLTKEVVEYRFDDHITDLNSETDAVDITFHKAPRQSYDFLVICDGLYSKTRQLAQFDKDDINFVSLNKVTAYFTIEDRMIDVEDKFAKWYVTTQGRHMLLRPDSTGKNTRAYLTIQSHELLDRAMSMSEQKAYIRQRFQECAYRVGEVLDGMDASANDFYMTDLAQVKCKTWSIGRIALCGDAAYCPSAITGQGTDCAVVGAYVLAGELSSSSDHTRAFRAYEKAFRPFVDEAQYLPTRVIDLLYPQTPRGVSILRLVQWFIWKSRVLQFLQSLPDFSFLFRSSYELPVYSF